jgi:hypothetical protein
MLAAVCGCLEPADIAEQESAARAVVIDARRSLAITDLQILERFPLERVLQQIIDTGAVTGPAMTPRGLFQQWWDTQNARPGVGPGPHCDDVIVDGQPALNGFPYTCRAEGVQATCDPFAPGSACAHIPIGLFMRFDLAPEDGRHCGEYRVVYAKETGRTATFDRSLVIFEAALRNPHYNQGLRGCRKMVEAWAELSTMNDLEDRADLLEEIYFAGYREYDPVIQASNFGDNPLGAGQVRTNQFVQPDSPRIWSLREFTIARPCSGGACTLQFVPVTDKTNPFGPLFTSPAAPGSIAADFQAELLSRLGALTASSVNGIGLTVSDRYNSGQSQAAAAVFETQYSVHFGIAPSPFRQALATQLAGTGLEPAHVIQRVQAMSCAGCHRFSSGVDIGGGLLWPASQGFTHVSERDAERETAGGVSRYGISAALVEQFLPHRKQLAEKFLADVPRPSRPPGEPIGGRWTH